MKKKLKTNKVQPFLWFCTGHRKEMQCTIINSNRAFCNKECYEGWQKRNGRT